MNQGDSLLDERAKEAEQDTSLMLLVAGSSSSEAGDLPPAAAVAAAAAPGNTGEASAPGYSGLGVDLQDNELVLEEWGRAMDEGGLLRSCGLFGAWGVWRRG